MRDETRTGDGGAPQTYLVEQRCVACGRKIVVGRTVEGMLGVYCPACWEIVNGRNRLQETPTASVAVEDVANPCEPFGLLMEQIGAMRMRALVHADEAEARGWGDKANRERAVACTLDELLRLGRLFAERANRKGGADERVI